MNNIVAYITCMISAYYGAMFQCVLHYMVGSKEGVSGVSRDVVDILLYAGLMKMSVILQTKLFYLRKKLYDM